MLCPNHELMPFFFFFTKHDAMTISSRTKAATMFDADILKAGTRCHKPCRCFRPATYYGEYPK
jgi:hypothetical protein